MARVWRLTARCCLKGALTAAAIGSLIVGAAVLAGLQIGVELGLILAATLLVFALHSAWRMAQGLAAFAEAVPGQPRVQASAEGRARLDWPSLGLVVEGEAAVLHEPDLEAEAGGEPLQAPVDEGRQLAEQALSRLGVAEPSLETEKAAEAPAS